jgi:hypothetical protein
VVRRDYVVAHRRFSEIMGHSHVAPTLWRTAEKLRRDAGQAEEGPGQRWLIPGAICLYHAAIECYVNETLGYSISVSSSEAVRTKLRKLQDLTLGAKIDRFLATYRIKTKFSRRMRSRVLLLSSLRNRLYHHSPEHRAFNLFPREVLKALRAADVPLTGASWVGECHSPKLARWASATVPGLIDEFCRAVGMRGSHFDLPGWGRNPPYFDQ